jgi:hypothetical protein
MFRSLTGSGAQHVEIVVDVDKARRQAATVEQWPV